MFLQAKVTGIDKMHHWTQPLCLRRQIFLDVMSPR